MVLSDPEYFIALGVAYLMLDEGLDNALHILRVRRYAPQTEESFFLGLEFYSLFYPHFKNLENRILETVGYIERGDYALPSRVAEFLGLPNHAKGIDTKTLEPIAYRTITARRPIISDSDDYQGGL